MSAATIEARGVGVHTDMTDAEYFAHPALSHSDCKLILDSPARYRHAKDNPSSSKPTDDMIFGTAVHSIALGGPGVVRIPFDDYRSKDARDARDEALAAGQVPLKPAEYDEAKACADAIRLHPRAKQLLDLADHLEVSAVWDDGDVQRRAKLDAVAGRFGIDLKTAANADTDAFAASVAKFGYWTQDPYYRDAMRAVFGIDDPAFLFIVVEKRAPYLVNVIQLEEYAVELGAQRNRRAIDLYRECRDSDTWPGYGDGINEVTLPAWAAIQEENQ